MIQVKTVTSLWSNGPDDPTSFAAADVFFGMNEAEARRLEKVATDLAYLPGEIANLFDLFEEIGRSEVDIKAHHLAALSGMCQRALRSWGDREGEELIQFSTLIRERLQECGFAPVK